MVSFNSFKISVFFFQLDLDKPIEDQGPFDLVLHKFTDKFGAAAEGHEESVRHLQNLEVRIEEVVLKSCLERRNTVPACYFLSKITVLP